MQDQPVGQRDKDGGERVGRDLDHLSGRLGVLDPAAQALSALLNGCGKTLSDGRLGEHRGPEIGSHLDPRGI